MNKYIYYKVIQTNSGYGWADDDFHEANSSFMCIDRKTYKENLKAYREAGGFSVRVINRREVRE
jgi:hypothetical protein